VTVTWGADRDLVGTLGAFDVNRPPVHGVPDAPFKQWVHTTVWHPALTLVANFSSVHAKRGGEHRVTTLVYGDRVAGHVRLFPAAVCDAPVGRATAAFGPNRVRRIGPEYDVELFEPELDLRATLTLRAATHASTTVGVRLGGGGRLGWSVIPRLVANGTIQYAGRVYEIEDAPAYRDRNWGCFAFGELSWDWLYTLAGGGDSPWAVVVSRLTDRARSRIWQQAVLVWERSELLATFRDRDVTIRGSRPHMRPVTTVPAALGLCRPGEATDVPRSVEVEGRSSRGHVRLAFEADAVARVVVPNDARLGTTPIYESLGHCRVTGDVEGRAVEFEGHGFLECLHA
jgi:hypothetical protein